MLEYRFPLHADDALASLVDNLKLKENPALTRKPKERGNVCPIVKCENKNDRLRNQLERNTLIFFT